MDRYEDGMQVITHIEGNCLFTQP